MFQYFQVDCAANAEVAECVTTIACVQWCPDTRFQLITTPGCVKVCQAPGTMLQLTHLRAITITLSLFIAQLFKQRTAFVAFSNVSILSKTSSGSFSSSSALESFSELVSELGWDYFVGLKLFVISYKFSPTTKKRSGFSAQLFISLSSLLESSLGLSFGCFKPSLKVS